MSHHSKRPIRNADRDRDIAKLAESGKRQVELAELYGISQPRVAQIVAKARKLDVLFDRKRG